MAAFLLGGEGWLFLSPIRFVGFRVPVFIWGSAPSGRTERKWMDGWMVGRTG